MIPDTSSLTQRLKNTISTRSWQKRFLVGLVLLSIFYYGAVELVNKNNTKSPTIRSAVTVTLKNKSNIAVQKKRQGIPSPPIINYTLEELFQVHFPECAPSTNATNVAEDWISWFRQQPTSGNIQYIPSTRPPRYDHISCFLMKARYNCAPPPGSTSAKASDNQMMFWRHHNGETQRRPCNLHSLVDFVGGPMGVYAHWMHRQQPNSPNHSSNQKMQIVLQGNSYLRQVWEALLCGFRDQITNVTVVQGGPMLSLAYLASRSGKLITPRELGTFVVLPGLTCRCSYFKSHLTDWWPYHRTVLCIVQYLELQ